MKITYDKNQEVYLVQIEGNETICILNTNDIVEARDEFTKLMTNLFNNVICKQFSKSNEECDHEWECHGMDALGSTYTCKKCHAYNYVPNNPMMSVTTLDCKEDGIDKAVEHFKHGVSHDIFSEPVTSYAKLAIAALEKYKND